MSAMIIARNKSMTRTAKRKTRKVHAKCDHSYIQGWVERCAECKKVRPMGHECGTVNCPHWRKAKG